MAGLCTGVRVAAGEEQGYRLIPSKLAAIPRWNSDQSKPSASAT
jgi:hypothetical protein